MAIKINLMPLKENESRADAPTPYPFYFIIVSVFLAISIAVYLGIMAYYNFVLVKQLENAEKQNIALQQKISNIITPKTSPLIITTIVKGKNIESIFSTHLYNSKIYSLLEKITLKNVLYNNFSEIVSQDNTANIKLDGEAESFGILAKQLSVYKKTKEIKKISFNEALAIKNGKVSFSVELIFDSNLITSSSK